MSGLKKVMIVGCCVLLLAVGWLTALFSKSDAARQRALMADAQSYLDDEIYVKAVPLLEQAAQYKTKRTVQAEELLKQAYLPLLEQSGYRRKYTGLLDKQMARKNADPAVYLEAARYYLDRSKYSDAFSALKLGIEKTDSQELTDFYEAHRYEYTAGRGAYQQATAFLNGYIQVRQDGFWGLARPNGELILPCEYDFLSTCSGGEVIALQDGVLSGIDLNGNRVALYKGDSVKEVSNFDQERLALHRQDGWVLADGTLNTGSAVLEEIRTFSDGGAAAKQNGKWGVLDRSGTDWLVEPEYDGIVCDDLGRCWKDKTVFVRRGDQVLLLADGKQVGEPYEDARPFAGGWAAVKRDGQWGFIDQKGEVQIDFQFEDARSFTMHLAAVKKNGSWGYVGLSGDMVIRPVFGEAKPFEKGTAPVKTGDGWQFITLLEYKTETTGF